jgi:predicted component of type VI protein secretion system
MKISDTKEISIFISKLNDFPISKSNKEEINSFIEDLKLKLSSDFGLNHYLTNKINGIVFSPKFYFPEMKEIEQSKFWNEGIKKLRETLFEIIEESQKVLDLSDIKTIENVVTSGIETNLIELKSTLRWDLNDKIVNKDLEKMVLKAICALNNFEGGNLFIGVDDNGNILGLEDDFKTLENGLGNRDKFELHLRNLLNEAYSKSYIATNIEILFPKPKDIEICQVKVGKGKQPLFLKAGNSKGLDIKERFYIRSGNQSVEIEKVTELVNYAINHFG